MSDTERFGSVLPWWLGAPSAEPHYRVYCRAYAAASALRLTLPDATQPDWLGPVLLHAVGAIVVAVNGSFVGWLACALGALWPIVALQDQLSQSLYLAVVALAALASFQRRLAVELASAVRWLTIGVYGLAALHKVNRDYLDPSYSCANEGLRVLVERTPSLASPELLRAFDHGAWPVVHLGVEVAIVVLLLGRPRLGVTLAALMHVPLTIIFAPGFAFTMMSGWVAFFTFDELTELVALLRRRWPVVVALGGVPAALSRAFLFPGRWSTDPDWCVKEVLVWLVAAWLLVAAISARRASRPRRQRFPGPAAGLLVGGYLANGLTPYFGLQLHHTAAMLSNLRIDEGCHNSLVFPAALATDPYVRLDAIHFAPHRAEPETRAAFEARLWELGALFEARARWCEIHDEPLPAQGRYRGRSFATDDLCASDGWPLPEPVLLGLRRFQVNLRRECPQRCLH